MTNRDLYFRDPTTLELLNNGVSKVAEIGHDERQIQTLRFELTNFVCDGEYARGLERILKAYLDGLGRQEQQAVWVSGFFGSGKSHLVKVLRYLWEDYHFVDGATARSLVTLPAEITDLLKELSNRSKPMGGLRAAAGTLGAGSMDNVRLAFIQLVLRAAGLPENLAQAKFILWLRSSGLEAKVDAALKQQNRELGREVLSLKLSMPLAEALVSAEPKYANAANTQAAIRDQFKDNNSPTIDDALDVVRQIFGSDGKLPCTLLVLDEIQQFIGGNNQRGHDIQEIAEHCCTDMGSRLLIVGTGQAALHSSIPALEKLQARFTVKVQLSDTDVESVIRKTVLRKKPEQEAAITACMEANQGELARHLQNTRLAATHEDNQFFVADYPLLPTRRRFWEKVLRNTDHSGTKAQLRSQLQIVFEATKQTAGSAVGTVVPADFIYDQISTDLLNSGELEREYDEIIRKQRDGTKEGDLRSSLCALIFLIGKLRSRGTDDGVRATAETLVDLLVSDLKNDRPKLELQVPKMLKQLVDAGQLMAVENEYLLQTREGALWTHDFNRRRTSVLNDDQRINTKRAELLRDGTKQALKPVSLR